MKTLGVTVLAMVLATAAARAATPNLVVVLVDDAGYGDFGCHGHPFLKTPNIDRLHGESVRFTDFHVAPMCTPTRGQLMTGQDALRNAASSVTAGRAVLRPGIPTLPERLAAAGWGTGIFGKWHLGDSYPHRPVDKGFQTAFWLRGWGFTSAPEFANTLDDGTCLRGTQPSTFRGYVTDVCFDEAMAWMRGRKAASTPFFCYIPLHAAHAPHVVADTWTAPYTNVAPRVAGFFGMLANIDWNMGRLDAFLRDSGLRDDTLLVFMTDNGGTAGVRHYNAGLRGHKTEYYDGGHRVPCFVRWPAGKLRAPGDIAMPAQIQDLFPTFLDLCGLEPPAGARFDGVSLAPLLRGTGAPADRMLVVQYGQSPDRPEPPARTRSCVIWNRWRLVHDAELYDIVADRAQTNDVAAKHPEIVQRMRAHYDGWWKGIAPAVNDFVPFALGAEAENPVTLSSSDWQDVYADNAGHIRNAAGGPRGGPWNVDVARAGRYEIRLRRWPFEVDTPLDGNVTPPGKPLPIAAARLAIAGVERTVKTAPGAKEAVATLGLPAGRTQLHAWFQDAEGRDLCGAFYAQVRLMAAGK